MTGLVFCADCGKKMYNHRRSTIYDAYDCSTYKITFNRTEQQCRSHYIGTKPLRSLILETIRTASTYAIEDQDEFIRHVREASEVRQIEEVKSLKKKINKARKRCAELDVLIKKLYESFAKEQISEKRFSVLCAEYEKEQAELETLIEAEQVNIDAFMADTARVEQFLDLAKKYTDFSELTTPMLLEFVDKVLVHAPEKIDGERTQEVEIFLKFIGKFAVPLPELTPEELAEEERRKRHRAANRAYARKCRERKKAERLALEAQKKVQVKR